MQSGMQAAVRWSRDRSWHHARWSAERLAAERRATISVCLPARNEAATIGPILDALTPLLERGAIDELVVVDDSIDGTADIALAHGAQVFCQSSLRPEFGPVQGKGDALWRSLEVLRGDVICFLDADSELVGPHYVTGLAGPIACGDGLQFVKAFYRRPLRVEGRTAPQGGGRVTELVARPLLNAFFPELAGFRQPLAGEFAARRDLLVRLPFATGYAVDIALLIDAWAAVGLDAMAQVDLDVRQNRHQPLADLVPMATAVLHAVLARVHGDGRLQTPPEQRLTTLDARGETLLLDTVEQRPPAVTLVEG
jgi:glucosyl-3-phosphoglycerate synthase